jgi:LytS/YehU family sensor histidine kinase
MEMTALPAMRFGPAPALEQLVSCTRRQLSFSAILALLVVGTLLWRRQYDMLAMFAGLMLTASLVLLGEAFLRRLLPSDAGWRWCWALQPPLLLLAASVVTYAYGRAAAALYLKALDSAQMLGSALAFGAMVAVVPLLYAQRQANALRLSELERAALSSELKSLQAQVEPHFLYNTLANTRYLARHAPERAVEMLDHLIAYLRTALPDMRLPSSTLGRECDLAGHYLALMEIRFGTRLATSIDCPASLRDMPVPPMMLMSLVENAVQHGVEPKPGAVRVSIAAALRSDGRLGIVVRDDGGGLLREHGAALLGSGVGLRNVRERLQALYAGNAAFALRQAADGATEAELLLPAETGA